MNDQPVDGKNPYVGPRTFSNAEKDRFYGREREARNLLARVLSEHLLLFYAQSGAGKSSLLNARLIPQLAEEEGFVVLPVARVSGNLPAGAEHVRNIHLFNLMASLDPSGQHLDELSHISLKDFLARLVASQEGPDQPLTWRYDPAARSATEDAPGLEQPYALIIDQFEEIVTTHTHRWRERNVFFQELNEAMEADPWLWVILTLREDYVAALDPYAHLLANRMRARFYMERMDRKGALEAIRQPALSAGRPISDDAAIALVDNLSLTRVAGQKELIIGQYVEPVQLQVVCYQLWENLRGQPAESITINDLTTSGDVDESLANFYVATIAEVTGDPSIKANEHLLRTWFSKELITQAGTRGNVYRDENSGRSGSLENRAVDKLAARFLLRSEAHAGGQWVELVHDRFIDPITASNQIWFSRHSSTFQRQASLWMDQGRPERLLLQDSALQKAAAWTADNEEVLEEYERDFLKASRNAEQSAAQDARRRKQIRLLELVAFIFSILVIAALITAGFFLRQDLQNAEEARNRLEQLRIVMGMDPAEHTPSRLQAATLLIQFAEELADRGNIAEAEEMTRRALEIWPPATPVWIEPGEFTVNLPTDDNSPPGEAPVHMLYLDGYWSMPTEVSNGQYAQCVKADICEPPSNEEWSRIKLALRPVTHVDLNQARTYAEWVGGRLPTEAEWENACRNAEGERYPWGDDEASAKHLNYDNNIGATTDVGSYPPGANNLYDMAGNVWEWTDSQYRDYLDSVSDAGESLKKSGDHTVRGGSYTDGSDSVRCVYRSRQYPGNRIGNSGFRVVWSADAYQKR